jgi:hypothetical protein
MEQFRKLTRNLFLTLRGQNAHRQQRQMSPSRKLATRPRSKYEKRTAGSARETLTAPAADGVRCVLAS